MTLPRRILPHSLIHLTLLVLSALTLSGCSLFFGNIKPLDEKSANYEVIDLSTIDPNWIIIHSKPLEDEKEERKSDPGSQADTAYQSKKTASIVSINSACLQESIEETKDLKTLTQRLLLGITDISRHEQKSLIIAGSPALETIVQGRLDGEEMTLKTVVIEKDHCTYDLMYIARPRYFSSELPLFSKFITSLKIK